MDDNIKELIERYLYDVVRHLPENQREDIKKELRTVIEDMAAEREGLHEESEEACIRAVLTELGNPEKLSRSYRGNHNSLISGEYYDKYCFILKTVLIWVSIAIVISALVSAVVSVVESPQAGSILSQGTAELSGIEAIADAAWQEVDNIFVIPAILLQVFAVITLIFAAMERKMVKMEQLEEEWKLEKLPEIPAKKAVIGRGESAVGVVFGILFLVLLIFMPQLFGAWIKEGDVLVSIPLFNLRIWNQIVPFLAIGIMAGLVDDLTKLIVGRYHYAVMTVNLITGMVSLVVTFCVFKFFPVWNPEFVPKLQEMTGKTINSSADILMHFNTNAFTNGFLLIFLLIMLVDMGRTVYYTVKYGENGSRKG